MPDEQRDQAVTTSPRYDEDFYAWTQHQATVLGGALCPGELDALNLAEEIEDLGKSHRRELRSRLRVLVMHLLKWRYQPEGRMDSHRAYFLLRHHAAVWVGHTGTCMLRQDDIHAMTIRYPNAACQEECISRGGNHCGCL